MVPDLRPSRPLRTGPILLAAFSPTEWHGPHFLKDCSPAARSWACAIAIVRPSDAAASISAFIVFNLLARPEPPFWPTAGGCTITLAANSMLESGFGSPRTLDRTCL